MFQVLPARLRARQYDAIPATARGSAPHSARGGGSLGPSRPMSLRRQGSVDGGGGGAEPALRQCSASSIRTPSLKRAAAAAAAANGGVGGLAHSGAPGRGRARSGLLGAAVGGSFGRRHRWGRAGRGGLGTEVGEAVFSSMRNRKKMLRMLRWLP